MSISTLQKFQWVGILEGISYLLLVGVGMPLKYYMDMPTPNKVIGMAHGFLFILYLYYLFVVYKKYNWTFKELCIGLIASFLPFATFFTHKIHDKH